jgi:toxin ParE1/3/4
MAEYRLAPAAERDLEKVWTYTVQHWGLGQANRYIDIISTAFQELAQ